jgi:glycosyltransferase involved in cell wall biosynthesis
VTPTVLFLTTELPWPLDGGGKLRTFETLASLSGLARVTVLSFAEPGETAPAERALADRLPGVTILPPVPHPIRIRRNPGQLLRTLAISLATGLPYLAAKFEDRVYRRRALAAAAEARPDLIWCDHLNVFAIAAAVRDAAPGHPALVLDEHNVESDLFARASGAGALATAARLEAPRVVDFERASLAAADGVVAIGPDDAARLVELGGGERVRAVLPSVGTLPPPREAPAAGGPAVFLASLSWPPNAEAARFLALEVLPRLRRRLPGARAVIGGKGLGAADLRAIRAAGAEPVGFVEDAERFHREASVAVVPVLSGSGISIKLLDALKADVPVVSTTVGARSLPVAHDRELLIADGAEAFAEAVARAMTDEALRRRLVANGRTYLERHHTREVCRRSHAEVIAAALARRPASRSA